jgi:putative transposase
VETLATLSNGEAMATPRALHSNLKKLRQASRQHSRKKKSSKKRVKATQKREQLHAHIANIRKDTLHKAHTFMVMKTKSPEERPHVIVLENLQVSGMLKHRPLSGTIADVGFSKLRHLIESKVAQTGVVEDGISLGAILKVVVSSERDWISVSGPFRCASCGLMIERDTHAASSSGGVGREIRVL